jgi:hypothetical protein
MLSEKPACGFFYCFIIFSITQIEKFTERKTGTPVFPIAFFQTACDSCAGDKPEQSTTAQEKCDSRRFAIACKPKACVPPQAGFARLGLFAVEYLIHPNPALHEIEIHLIRTSVGVSRDHNTT